MNKEMNKKELAEALAFISNAFDAGKNDYVRFRFETDKTILSGAGDEMQLQTVVSSVSSLTDDAKAKTAVFKCSYISAAVSKINDPSIRFEYEDGDRLFKVSGGTKGGKFEINVYPDDIIPEPDFKTESPSEIVFNKKQLEQSIDKIMPFTEADNKNSSRQMLKGVNFDITKDTIILGGTDSYCMARIEYANENKVPECNVTIPKNALKMIRYIANDNVKMSVFDSRVQISGNKTIIQSRIYSGDYPDLKRLIPGNDSFVTDLFVKKDVLRSALESAGIIKSENMSVVKLEMNKDNITLSSRSQEFGGYSEKLDEFGAKTEGSPLKLSFCVPYVMNALKALDNEEIRIRFSGQLRPFIITDGNPEEMYLALPVRTFE